MLLRCTLVVALLTLPVDARAAEPASGCGTTAHDAIAISEKTLATKTDAGREHALDCLLQAVKQLDDWKASLEPAHGHAGIAVPAYTGAQGAP